jgi:hypothetical protein
VPAFTTSKSCQRPTRSSRKPRPSSSIGC